MGTRGLIGIRVGGQFHGTYNHFDSYPEGLGEEVADFAANLNPAALETFRGRAQALTWVDAKSTPTPEQIDRYKKFADEDVSSKKLTEWYVLLRAAQGVDTLKGIADGSLAHLIDNSEFVKDSVFCEYAYILDLDRAVLEFYKGFQREPQTGNPFGVEKDKHGYFPVAKVGEKPFADLAGWQRFYGSDEED